MSKTLIICRVESAEKAPAWLAGVKGAADHALSLYGAPTELDHHHFVGGKWTGIYDFLTRHPDLIDIYDYFWFPDDDIDTTPAEVERFLAICRSERFELAQPALTPGSVYAYRMTIGNPRFDFRRTNFVELMMPLLHRDLLRKVLPLFKDRHAALGIDWMWHRLATEPARAVAIVDGVVMGHYRPRNTHLVSRMKQQNISVVSERDKTMRELDIQPLTPVAHAGRLRNGAETRNRFAVALKTVSGYYAIRNDITQSRWKMKHFFDLLINHVGHNARHLPQRKP